MSINNSKNFIVFFSQVCEKTQNYFTFAVRRRDGRVVECGGLENHCTAMYRGFESLSLRKTQTKMFGFFYFIDLMKVFKLRKPSETEGFLY